MYKLAWTAIVTNKNGEDEEVNLGEFSYYVEFDNIKLLNKATNMAGEQMFEKLALSHDVA